MSSESPALVQKIWNYCDILRDGGISYGDYVDQLTSLLFLKMRDEQTKPPYNESRIVPEGCGWDTLLARRGSDLQSHYEKVLRTLSKQDGLLGLIYRDATNKIRKPAKLEQLIHGLDNESWASLTLDVKGEIYEGLLEKHSGEAKGTAGQYFTPRALISAMVEVLDPRPGETICDPSCGTGGFFLEARRHVTRMYKPLDRDQRNRLQTSTFYGTDITPDVVRLCAMNMYLHNLGTIDQILEADSLLQQPSMQYDIIMTNPPFGSATPSTSRVNGKAVRDGESYGRDDFWTTGTRDKQLNFLQNAYSSLKVGGRCGIVLPDGVLFGTTRAHVTIRDEMMKRCDVHTILRLPTGIFYANGVKTNVVFFEKKQYREDGKPWTSAIWFYDLRTNMNFTQKENKMQRHHLDDFVKHYTAKKRRQSERFKKFTFDEIAEKGSWDMVWIKDNSIPDVSDLPDVETIMTDITHSVLEINKAVEGLKMELDNKQS